MTTANAFTFPSFPGADKFAPEAFQAALRPVIEQAQAWAELGKKHFEETRIAAEAALKSASGIKDPQAALELVKTNTQQGLLLASEQLRETADLGVQQFHAALEQAVAKLPSSEAFAPLAKSLKTGVDMAHTSLTSAIDQVAPAATKKTARRG